MSSPEAGSPTPDTPDHSPSDSAIAPPPPRVPPGWYPTETGESRYWDGVNWASPAAGPDADPAASSSRPNARNGVLSRRVVVIAVAALVVLGAGGGLAWKLHSDQVAAQVAAAKHAAAVKKEKAREAAASAKEAADDAERSARQESVTEIEASIKTMAQKDVTDGVLDGPVLSVSCSPVAGGSTDDLSQKTTVFQCFVADKNNADGSQSGYYFHATMNWSTDEYTYGLGDAS